MKTWSDTTAQWDGEDWVFRNIPINACPEWGGTTCFSPEDLGVSESAAPEKAVAALKNWLTTP
jgi:hypothetical protein